MDNSHKINPMPRTKEDRSINLLDIFRYLFFQWKWFLLSILIFGGYYLYQYSKTPFIYSRSETIMIKTIQNTMPTTRITRTSANAVSVASEILQLRSKELMRKTIARIDGDVSYSIKKGLRRYELYKDAPIKVNFVNARAEDGFSFQIRHIDQDHVALSTFSKYGNIGTEMKVKLNQTVRTPVGELKVTRAAGYQELAFEYPITVRKYPREQMVGYYMSNLKINQMEEDASLLQVFIEDNSPQRADDLITTLVTVYNEDAVEDKNKVAINTAEFIQDRIQIIESELGSVESSLENLKVSNQGIDINAASQMYVSEGRALESTGNDIETQLKLVELMQKYLRDADNKDDLIPNNTGLVDVNLEAQINDYNTALLRRNRLVEGSSSENPIVNDLNVALAAMRKNIYRAMENAINGLQVKINNAKKEEASVRNKAMEVPAKQRMLLSVERQQKVKEELYLLLLNKREENAINQAMTDDNIRIIDPASGSDSPIYPNRIKKTMLGLGIGVALPAMVFLLMLMLNTGVRNRKDVEDVLSVPFLGEIPYTFKQKRGDAVVEEKGRDLASEAFRILRTNIGFMNAGEERRVITFTSFNVGAGKTFTAINLASSFKYLNKRVLLLDLDLRKGTLSEKINAPKGMGVTNFLADSKVVVDDIIYKGVIANTIDVIPVGVIAPNPVELLLSPRLDELVFEIKERYDYIIVDNVPINLVADASIVDRISELTIFVIRAGKMDRRQLPEIQALYEQKKLSNMAVLLNGIRLDHSGYGYGYGYGYGNEKDRSIIDKLFGRRV